MMAGAPVSWWSKKQATIALSSYESEVTAASEAAREIVWLRSLLSDLGIPQSSPTVLRLDNQSAQELANGGGSQDRRKHIDIKHLYIIEAVTESKSLAIKWIQSENNLADIFTKPFDKDHSTFIALRNRLVQ